MSLIFEKWAGTKFTATQDTWSKALDYNREKRWFLKLHNRSKDIYVKVAFSKDEADNDIYVLVAPGGFWEMENVVPRNEIWINGEAGVADFIIYQLTY